MPSFAGTIVANKNNKSNEQNAGIINLATLAYKGVKYCNEITTNSMKSTNAHKKITHMSPYIGI